MKIRREGPFTFKTVKEGQYGRYLVYRNTSLSKLQKRGSMVPIWFIEILKYFLTTNYLASREIEREKQGETISYSQILLTTCQKRTSQLTSNDVLASIEFLYRRIQVKRIFLYKIWEKLWRGSMTQCNFHYFNTLLSIELTQLMVFIRLLL